MVPTSPHCDSSPSPASLTARAASNAARAAGGMAATVAAEMEASCTPTTQGHVSGGACHPP
jgi:anti-sigma factor RsiW